MAEPEQPGLTQQDLELLDAPQLRARILELAQLLEDTRAAGRVYQRAAASILAWLDAGELLRVRKNLCALSGVLRGYRRDLDQARERFTQGTAK